MSYLTFLLVWIVPVIVGLLLLRRSPVAGVGGARARWALLLTCGIAFVWTTPWDNYLVWRGVWGYGTSRIIGTVGYVPIEEYAFFLLQPILTGLLLYRLLERLPAPTALPRNDSVIRYVGIAITGFISLYGTYLLARPSLDGTYMGLILAWAMPVVGGMWLYGGPHFWAWRRPLLLALVPATLYLWTADRFAISRGIWDIDNRLSFNLDPLGLPIEEAVFFLVTNVLALARHPALPARRPHPSVLDQG